MAAQLDPGRARDPRRRVRQGPASPRRHGPRPRGLSVAQAAPRRASPGSPCQHARARPAAREEGNVRRRSAPIATSSPSMPVTPRRRRRSPASRRRAEPPEPASAPEPAGQGKPAVGKPRPGAGKPSAGRSEPASTPAPTPAPRPRPRPRRSRMRGANSPRRSRPRTRSCRSRRRTTAVSSTCRRQQVMRGRTRDRGGSPAQRGVAAALAASLVLGVAPGSEDRSLRPCPPRQERSTRRLEPSRRPPI